MSGNTMIVIIFGGSLAFASFVIFRKKPTKSNKHRDASIKRCTHLIQAMVNSLGKHGSLRALNHFDEIMSKINRHNLHPSDLDVGNFRDLARIAANAYGRGIAGLKKANPLHKEIGMMKESLAAFKKQWNI